MEKKKILIVDDEVDFCMIVQKNLEMTERYSVIMAHNGKNGIRAARKERPDIMLLDINMPGISGLSVLEKLKGDSRTSSIPVVMLTAFDDDKHKSKAALLYDEAYITKPISMTDLIDKIEEVFRRQGI